MDSTNKQKQAKAFIETLKQGEAEYCKSAWKMTNSAELLIPGYARQHNAIIPESIAKLMVEFYLKPAYLQPASPGWLPGCNTCISFRQCPRCDANHKHIKSTRYTFWAKLNGDGGGQR